MISDTQAAALRALCAKHPDHRLAKYRDWRACCRVAEYYASMLGLADSPPLRILDMGGGLSYFAAECRALGHDATTLDLPDELPEQAAEMLGVPYIACLIVDQLPLPGEDTYDLITAIRLNMTEPDRWGWDEYAWFGEHVMSRLRPSGRWFMAPNRGRNVDFVLDAARWMKLLPHVIVRNPTKHTILIEQCPNE